MKQNTLDNALLIIQDGFLSAVCIDLPTDIIISSVYGRYKSLEFREVALHVSFASIAYIMRHIARGRLADPKSDTPVPGYGALAGAMKYGLNYLFHSDNISFPSFLYSSARGALNIALYEGFREPIGEIITEPDLGIGMKILGLGLVFGMFEMLDSGLAAKSNYLEEMLIGLFITGLTTGALVMLSENTPNNQKSAIALSFASLATTYSKVSDVTLKSIAVTYAAASITLNYADSIFNNIYNSLADNAAIAR